MEKFPRFEKQQPLSDRLFPPNPLTNKRSWKQFSKVSLSNKFPSFERAGERRIRIIETKQSSKKKKTEMKLNTSNISAKKLVWKIAFLSQIVRRSRFVRHSTNKRDSSANIYSSSCSYCDPRGYTAGSQFINVLRTYIRVYIYIFIRVLSSINRYR